MIDLVTRGFFEIVWLLIQANWIRRLRGRSSAFLWSISFACLLPALFVLILVVAILCAVLRIPIQAYLGWFASLSFLSIVIVRTFAVFTFRMELAQEPIGLRTGYWMTIFFGTIYLQYRLGQFSRSLKTASVSEQVANTDS